ncbi:MAG: AbrB/MazE/SpoVT family DNA-binding domain-containing protein [Thermoplasmataceae archaeon]
MTHVSKRGVSFRITLPKTVREKLRIGPGDVVGFYEENGKVFLKKMD